MDPFGSSRSQLRYGRRHSWSRSASEALLGSMQIYYVVDQVGVEADIPLERRRGKIWWYLWSPGQSFIYLPRGAGMGSLIHLG